MRHSILILAAMVASASSLFAEGGTDIVANKGQPAYVQETWPAGVDVIVNDPVRTTGWNSWFSEWPNDVNQYAMEIKTTDDLNRLIEKLAAVKGDVRQILLSCEKEPGVLGWVTHAPKDSHIPVIFSIGDQTRMDAWYKNVRKPFGVIEFTACPVAVPPTLTIFVQNDAVKLEELKIPVGITVSQGGVPTAFHRSNMAHIAKPKDEAAKPPVPARELDAATQKAADRIGLFLKQRATAQAKPVPADTPIIDERFKDDKKK